MFKSKALRGHRCDHTDTMRDNAHTKCDLEICSSFYPLILKHIQWIQLVLINCKTNLDLVPNNFEPKLADEEMQQNVGIFTQQPGNSYEPTETYVNVEYEIFTCYCA